MQRRIICFPVSRPSTPIYSLLENQYGEKWIAEQREAERVTREEAESKRLRGKVYETRATLLRRYSEPVEPPPYWKMKRWSRVSAKSPAVQIKGLQRD